MRLNRSIVAGGFAVLLCAAGIEKANAEPELVWAFAFGSRNLECETASEPGTNYTMVWQQGNDWALSDLSYDPDREWGYEELFPEAFDWAIYGPFDDSANNRNAFPDDCPSQIYDSFIGAKNFLSECSELTVGDLESTCADGGITEEGIIFRVDVPNGLYRFVAAVGSADNRHAHRILAEDGGEGTPDLIGDNHVVLVHNYDQAEHGVGVFARVGFGCLLPPDPGQPQFVNMDSEGLITEDAPSSPLLEVTEGYIRIHQLQANSNDGAAGTRDPNGGDMVLLELWKVDGPDDGAGQPFSVSRSISPSPRSPGEAVEVTLSAAAITGATTITEVIPDGWSVVADGGGTVAGQEISFSVTADGDVTYSAKPDDDESCEPASFSGSAVGPGDCSAGVTGDSAIACIQPFDCETPPDAPAVELVAAFHFGAAAVDCASFNDPDVNFTPVVQSSPADLLFDEDRGWGYEEILPGDASRGGYGMFGPFDDSPNNRNQFPDACPEQLYDSMIGAKNFSFPCDELAVGSLDEPCEEGGIDPEGIIFRIDDIPNGKYRFVAAVGDQFQHAHRIVVENGGDGPPADRSDEFVVLVNNFDQNQYPIGETDPANPGRNVYARVGFDGRIPPPGDGVAPSPQFVNMDEFGEATEDCPSSPTLEVTEGYIRVHQLQGNSNVNPDTGTPGDANGGDLVLIELWRLSDDGGQEIRRGDANTDGAVNIADMIFMLNDLFGDGGAPSCLETADVNGDAAYNIADAIFGLNRLFGDGPPPIDGAGPEGTDCGADPNPATSLGCDSYDKCP